ncbi:protein DVR-1 homolog [Hydra vulgaris]|uniref:Protein DVR-1 homolog n=1 Tax=Hydra vulgaris TaxID=6087 RepID=A0ABM4BT06_HYDVU
MIHTIFLLTISVFIVHARLDKETIFPREEAYLKNASDFIDKSTESLLKIFGLSSSTVISENKEQPHKLMEYIYKTYTSMYERGLPLLADTVRGCTDLGVTSRRFANFPYVAYKFEIPKIQQTETLIKVELKILVRFSDFEIVNLNRNFLKLYLYGVLKGNKQENPLLIELATKVVPPSSGRDSVWITFEVTSFLLAQISQEAQKKYVKFALRIRSMHGGTTIPPTMVGVHDATHQKNVTEKNLLVFFSLDSVNKETRTSVSLRTKRGLADIKESEPKKIKKKKHHKTLNNEIKKCRRKNMKVNLSELKWDKWFMNPIKFNAYYCHGSCAHPLTITTDNHATIQSMMHKLNKKIVEPPCCVPTEYEKLVVLYMQEKTPTLRLVNGLIVKACGCK